MVHYYKVAGVVLLLCIGKVYAQDSTALFNEKIKENLSPIVQLKDDFYSSPALKLYQRKYSYSILGADYFNHQQDLYLQQKGKGERGFKVHSESYLKSDTKNVLWGNAYYQNETTAKVNYNETLDYDLVYPYVMIDTIGGDLPSETYYFNGGYSTRYKKLQYGFNGSFKGVQAYRAKDPRPLNTSSDIQFQLSAGMPFSSAYTFSLDLKGRTYHQKNTLRFANELGAPLIIHMAGLGVYNEFLAGSRTSANFNGNSFAVQLNVVPLNGNGFLGQFSYSQFKLNKMLSSIPFSVGDINEDQLLGMLGYIREADRNNYMIKLSAGHSKRAGTEPKFNNKDSEVGIQKVSEDVRFLNERLTLALDAVYGQQSNALNWYIGAHAKFINNTQQYVSPDRNVDYTSLVLGINVTAAKKINRSLLSIRAELGRQQNISSDYNWSDLNVNRGIYTMLANNYAYLTAESLNINGSIRLDLPLSQKLNLFVRSEGGYTRYEPNLKGTHLLFSTGFIF